MERRFQTDIRMGKQRKDGVLILRSIQKVDEQGWPRVGGNTLQLEWGAVPVAYEPQHQPEAGGLGGGWGDLQDADRGEFKWSPSLGLKLKRKLKCRNKKKIFVCVVTYEHNTHTILSGHLKQYLVPKEVSLRTSF